MAFGLFTVATDSIVYIAGWAVYSSICFRRGSLAVEVFITIGWILEVSFRCTFKLTFADGGVEDFILKATKHVSFNDSINVDAVRIILGVAGVDNVWISDGCL